ncbi:hypothetical protein Unana1_00537 [Umbelopsis nana]
MDQDLTMAAMQPSAILDTSLSKRNNVAALLAREIVFREARQPDHKMEALRKKYTPINEIGQKSESAARQAPEDTESFEHIALVDENGFEKAAKQLFDPKRLQLTWQSIGQVGLGIQNLGNTCFLSSTLQALSYIPAFAQYLLSEQHGRSCKFHDFCVLCALEQHVKQALERVPDNQADNSITPIKLVGKIRGNEIAIFADISVAIITERTGNSNCKHHEARETRRCTRISSTFAAGGSEVLFGLSWIFGGYLQSQIECLRCKSVTKSFEAFLDLSVDIHNGKSVVRAMDEFTNFHQMKEDNKYHCESCDDKVAARKRLSIYKAPRTLTVHLKRFSFKNGHINKIDKMVTYKEQLDIRPYMTDGQQQNVQGMYNLVAMVVHSGTTTHSGHYVAYVKSSNGMWYCMNDASVQQVSTQTVLNQKAYILFYALENSGLKPPASQEKNPRKEVKPKGKLKQEKAVSDNVPSDMNAIQDDDESGSLGVKISRKEFAKVASAITKPKAVVNEEKATPTMMTNKERKRLRKEKLEQARLAREQEQAQSNKEGSIDQSGDLSGPSTAIAEAVKELEETTNKPPEVDDEKLEEQRKLSAAMSAAASLPTVSSTSAIVVNYNDKMEDKRSKLDAVIQLEAEVGKAEDVKKTIFGVGSKKGQFGVDLVNRWDGDDMDICTPVSDADREAALRNAQGKKKKRVDAYDMDYDRGRVKTVKKKNNQQFEKKNQFQAQLDIENAVKANRFTSASKKSKKEK